MAHLTCLSFHKSAGHGCVNVRLLKTSPPHGSEKPEMATSETWEDFESALTSVLLDLEEREMITIKLAGGKVPFIQFAGLGSLNGVDEIRAEFSAENVKGDRGASTTFTPEQRAYFTQAGFTIAKEGLVWRRGYPWPTPSQTILDVVALTDTGAACLLDDTRSAVAWHPSGDLLATTNGDGACIIWNPHTGKPITTITDHTRIVTGIAWHPTGDLIATADASGLIRISHLDGTLERAFISVRPRVPGVESYASWTPQGLDVLEGEAWRVLRVPEPEDGS